MAIPPLHDRRHHTRRLLPPLRRLPLPRVAQIPPLSRPRRESDPGLAQHRALQQARKYHHGRSLCRPDGRGQLDGKRRFFSSTHPRRGVQTGHQLVFREGEIGTRPIQAPLRERHHGALNDPRLDHLRIRLLGLQRRRYFPPTSHPTTPIQTHR